MLRWTLRAIGVAAGGFAGLLLVGGVAGIFVAPPRHPMEPGAGLEALGPALFFGLPLGAFAGYRAATRVARVIEARAGTHSGPLGLLLLTITVASLIGWWVMELYGGW